MARPFALALTLVVLLLAGCSSAIKITGTLTVPLPESQLWTSPCAGMGGYTDLAGGTPITITDEAGSTIAIGALDTGTVIATPPQGHACQFTFAVTAPKGHKFYGVEIAHRGRTEYSADRLKQPLTLGPVG